MEAKEAGDSEDTGQAENTGEAEDAGDAKDAGNTEDTGEAKEAGKPKEAEDTDDDVVDVEVIESGGEEEWEETHEEIRVQVAGVELVISGPHDLATIIDRPLGT